MSGVLLSVQEVQELEKLCSDPFLELGMTLRPKHLECFERKVAVHYMKVIILFEKHEHAAKWNNMHKRHKHGQIHCKVGGTDGIPEKLVRNLMNRFPIHTVKFK